MCKRKGKKRSEGEEWTNGKEIQEVYKCYSRLYHHCNYLVIGSGATGQLMCPEVCVDIIIIAAS